MITENDSLNVDKNPLINISVNPNVLNSCESIPEVQASESGTEVLDVKDSVSEISGGFNPEVSSSLRPNGHKNPELREWEMGLIWRREMTGKPPMLNLSYLREIYRV